MTMTKEMDIIIEKDEMHEFAELKRERM